MKTSALMMPIAFVASACMGDPSGTSADAGALDATSADAAPYTLTLRISVEAADPGVEIFLGDDLVPTVRPDALEITRGFGSVEDAVAANLMLRSVVGGVTVDEESAHANICQVQCDMESCTWGTVLTGEVVYFFVMGTSVLSPYEYPLCIGCSGDSGSNEMCS